MPANLSEYLRITKDTPELLQVWFWDESGFSLRVIRKNWGKKGTRKQITEQSQRRSASGKYHGRVT
ncbi:MAG: hypothetical protein V7K89_31105 [Nostoc sp.]|uniref:hypothetical protein n=1 Tax=Nostoc sp. TaxID=1180 RepID=UPI002FF51098